MDPAATAFIVFYPYFISQYTGSNTHAVYLTSFDTAVTQGSCTSKALIFCLALDREINVKMS
jgi:hypothetical protein